MHSVMQPVCVWICANDIIINTAHLLRQIIVVLYRAGWVTTGRRFQGLHTTALFPLNSADPPLYDN